MKTVTIPIFEYDELPKETQEKIINESIEYMLEINWPSEAFQKACAKAEAMRTPWFVGEYIWEDCKEEVLNLCREHSYFRYGKIYTEMYYR